MVVAVMAAVVQVIFFKPTKTNSMYLRELIDSHTIEKSATAFVAQLRRSPDASNFRPEDWRQIEQQFSECLVREAKQYLASEDAYLSYRANRDTPNVLVKQFFTACEGLD